MFRKLIFVPLPVYYYSVMGIDSRNHGKSGDNKDKMCWYGGDEYKDFIGAYKFLQNEKKFGPNSIGLHGNSMSGGTAVISVAEEHGIKAAVVDSSIGDLKLIADLSLFYFFRGHYFFSDWMIAVTMSQFATLFKEKLGRDYNDYIPYKAALRISKDQSLYIVHAKQDAVTQWENSQLIYNSAIASGVNATLWITDVEEVQAGDQSGINDPFETSRDWAWNHLVSEVYFEEEYMRRVVAFYKTHLEKKER
jgi:dipeptidyl aminopeptidase/acylaminoacyl peptidase